MEELLRRHAAGVGVVRHWRDYYELCKPRVVALIVFTAIVGMFLATPGMVPWSALVFGTIGIGLSAASAACINQLVEQQVDSIMLRTSRRPLPAGTLGPRQAIVFAAIIGVLGLGILVLLVNPLTAALTFASLIGYAVIYTLFLKRATPQNIVIGGAAGAAPPVLGWTAVTGQVDPHSLLLFLIIFAWTPPHFWALAIARREEYAKVDIPMLPVTHGVAFTGLHVLLYTIILTAVTLLPYLTGMSGLLYLLGVVALDAVFLYHAICLYRSGDGRVGMKTFGYSIIYLMLLFALLMVDHYFPIVANPLAVALAG
ncbi:MAG: protoheme IX farnesyltransferase [Gammaproteobacteria bacterium SG8_47]|nr:MAG: protoheme IX farnesyltransferase [Gammaproteobacteria bacterium SG8_47]